MNGMEKDGEEWTGNDGSHLDFGARIYDSRLGRWLSIDPWVKRYPSMSPYAACNDNPILFIDPTGKGGVLSNVQYENGEWTADLIITVVLYTDPQSEGGFNTDGIKQILKDKLGDGYVEGANQQEYDAGSGYIKAKINDKEVDVKVQTKIVIKVMTKEEVAKESEESNIATNYFYVTTAGNTADGSTAVGRCKDAENGGAMNTNLLKDNFEDAIIEEPWHSMNPIYVEGEVGGHSEQKGSVMNNGINGGKELKSGDYDALPVPNLEISPSTGKVKDKIFGGTKANDRVMNRQEAVNYLEESE